MGVLPERLEQDEAAAIASRRAAVGLEEDTEERPRVGFAVSGGGIRSATLALGAFQAFERAGLLRFADYLSTVSGGGFFGGMFSAIAARRGGEASGPILDDEVVGHLRATSNYLAPVGIFDFLTIPAMLVRGMVLNGFVLFPAIFAAACLVTLVHGQRLSDQDLLRVELQAYAEELEVALGDLELPGADAAAVARRLSASGLLLDPPREAVPSVVGALASRYAGRRREAPMAVEVAEPGGSTWRLGAHANLVDLTHRLVTAGVLAPPQVVAEIDLIASHIAEHERRRRVWRDPFGSPEAMLAASLKRVDLERARPFGGDIDLEGWLGGVVDGHPTRRQLVAELYKAEMLDEAAVNAIVGRGGGGEALYAYGWMDAVFAAPYRLAPEAGLPTRDAAEHVRALVDCVRDALPEGAPEEVVPVFADGSPGGEVLTRLWRARGLDPTRTDPSELQDAAVLGGVVEPGWVRGQCGEVGAMYRRDVYRTLAGRGYRGGFCAQGLGDASECGLRTARRQLQGRLVKAIEGGGVSGPRMPTAGMVAKGIAAWLLLHTLWVAARRAVAPRAARRRDNHVLERSLAIGLLMLAAAVALDVLPHAVAWLHGLRDLRATPGLTPASVAALVAALVAGPAAAVAARHGRPVLLAGAAVLSLGVPLLVFLGLTEGMTYPGDGSSLLGPLGRVDGPLWVRAAGRPLLQHAVLLQLAGASFVLGFVVFGRLVDANDTGLHGFYRDRLAGAWRLGASGREAVGGPGLRMSALRGHEHGAPYHLINVTENVVDPSDPATRDRRARHYLVSRHWVGSTASMVRTERFEHLEPGFGLASAVAISGAAAAAAMGRLSQPLMAPLFTLLNVRMGFWAPNPAVMAEKTVVQRLRHFVGDLSGWLLFREAISDYGPRAAMSYLSDGGHVENTAAYALLQRRVPLIVVLDHGADPRWAFEDLGTLIRMARIDLKVRIDLDPGSLCPGDAGLAASNHVEGTVHYPDGTEGRIVWLKPALTADASFDLAEYRGRHPSFPQETTADQFFAEEQFEAYRAMGEHVATSALAAIQAAIEGRGAAS